MKNLKKVLALVLVVATLMSFATIAGAAKFTDAKSVKETEAVEVMSGIGVINGFTDGSFKPAENVTRAQMAKMVAYIISNGEDVGPLYAAANTFKDCTSHWAKGYIAYAAKTGFVAGVGNGKFNPEGKVTGVQAAKMLLVALGYDPAVQTYTGPDWSVNTLKDAKTAGLTAGFGVTFDFSKALTREQAAKMMFNALKATMVNYSSKGTNIIMNGVTINTGATKAEPVTDTAIRYSKINNKTVSTGVYTVELGEAYFDTLTKSASSTINGIASYTWQYKSKDISSEVSSDAGIAESNKGYSLNDMTTKKGQAGYKADKFQVVLSANPTYYVNGKLIVAQKTATTLTKGDYYLDTTNNALVKATTDAAWEAVAMNGVNVKFMDTDSDAGQAEKVLFEIAKFASVSSVATKAETKTSGAYTQYNIGGKNYKVYSSRVNDEADTAVVYDGIAKDDQVMVLEMKDGAAMVTKAASFEGTLTAKSSTGTCTINATAYDLSGLAGGTLTDLKTTPVFNTTYTYYTDAAGFIVSAKLAEAKAADTYGLVMGYQYTAASALSATAETSRVQIMLADGTVGVYDTVTKNGKPEKITFLNDAFHPGSSGTAANALLVKYTINDKKLITKIAAAGTEVTLSANVAAKTQKLGNLYLTADTKLIYMNSAAAYSETNKPKTAVGYSKLEAMTSSNKYFYVVNSSNANLIDVLYVTNASTGLASAEKYVYVNDTAYSTSMVDVDGSSVARYTYNVYMDGKATTLVSDKNDQIKNAKGLYAYTETDGLVSFTLVTGTTMGDNMACAWANELVTVIEAGYVGTTNKLFNTNSATKFYQVTTGDGADVVEATMSLSDFTNVNVTYTVQDKNGECLAIYFTVADR